MLGGVSLFGGRGTIVGPVIGALLLTALVNGLTLLGVSQFYQPSPSASSWSPRPSSRGSRDDRHRHRHGNAGRPSSSRASSSASAASARSRGASIAARTGEITAIVGDNGAGKSTLIRCVSGVHRPDEGRSSSTGRRSTSTRPRTAARPGIETVHQNLALVEDLTVWQNLFLNREKTSAGSGPSASWTGARCAARRTRWSRNLAVNVPAVRSRVRRLSGGQRQAVAICRAAGFGSRS